MPEAPVVINGLPLIAVVNAGYDSFNGESYADLDEVYWRRRDGSRGKLVSDKVRDRIDDCEAIEQVWDHLAYEQYVWDCALKGAPQVYQNGLEEGLTIDGYFQFD